MISRRSTGSSLASVSSTGSVAEHVLRKAYKDPSKLRQGLDQLWGQGQYTLRVRGAVPAVFPAVFSAGLEADNLRS
ncbi:hypothetical protein BKA56DRAFT_580637 [Ilyonectria sp. MPI-CAGE-AT-0026]|nr:hypothetical protein BKA56DRAFT_580637 [Ilyonectria sp. MPI-CAGE-AT-0026]